MGAAKSTKPRESSNGNIRTPYDDHEDMGTKKILFIIHDSCNQKYI